MMHTFINVLLFTMLIVTFVGAWSANVAKAGNRVPLLLVAIILLVIGILYNLPAEAWTLVVK